MRPATRLRPALATAVLALALALALAAGGAMGAQDPASSDWLVVVPHINTERKKDLFVRQTRDGDILVKRDDLPQLGLRSSGMVTVVIDSEAFVSLRSVAGLHWRLDPSTLELELLAEPKLLEATVIDAADRERRFERLGGKSAFLNWAVEHERNGVSAHWRLSSEAGLRLGSWLLQTSGQTVEDTSGSHWLRLASTALRDDPATQQRWMVGDFFFAAPELGSGANLGGLSISRVFTLNPYETYYPLDALHGQLQFPSDVEIWVDGQRVRTERLQPGDFEIRDLYLGQGSRDVQVVARDPYGRVRRFDYALYSSTQLLRQGVHEYNYAIGGMRRSYGLRSNDYGPAVFSFFHRYGLNDRWTLGLRGEGGNGLANAGILGTTRIGDRWGVLSWSAAGSRTEGVQGHATAVRYNYQSGPWGLGAALKQQSPGYAVLNDPRSLTNARRQVFLYGSRYWADWGTLSLAHSRQDIRAPEAVPLPAGYVLSEQRERRANTVGFSRYYTPWRSYFQLSASRLHDEKGARTELALGVTMFLDDGQFMYANGRRDGRLGDSSVELSRAVPLGEGWGYNLAFDRAHAADGGTDQWRGGAQYNARFASLRGDWRSASPGQGGDLRLGASGGLAWVGNEIYLGRPVQDSFAVVKLADLPDIPVRLNGVSVGQTDQHGELFVPTIGAFYEADLTVDETRIPIDHVVPALTRRIVLPARSGAVVDFGAMRLRALTARLLRPDGSRMAGGVATVRGAGPEIASVIGLDGGLYLENLPPARYQGQARAGSSRCSFEFEMPAGDAMFTELGDLVCR